MPEADPENDWGGDTDGQRLRRQHEALARLGGLALTDVSVSALAQEIAREGLAGTEAAGLEVRELHPSGWRLVVRAGAGACDPVGEAIDVELCSPEHRALDGTAPAYLRGAGAGPGGRGVCVAVGLPGARWGLLVAREKQRRFAAEDVLFLTSLGHILAGAVERRRLEKASVELEHSKGLRLVAGAVAHELGNIFTVVAAGASAFEPLAPPRGPLREDLGAITRALERGGRLVRRLLTFSGRRSTHDRGADLNEVVRDVAGMLRRMLQGDLEIVAAPAPGPLLVEADRDSVEQMVVNLAAAARDAAPAGATVRLETAVHTAGAGTAESAGPDVAAFTVSLAPSDGPSAAAPLPNLALVRALAARWHGDVRVERARDGGATLTVLLPCQRPGLETT